MLETKVLYTWNDSELQGLNKTYHPLYVKKVDIGKITNLPLKDQINPKISMHKGIILTSEQIDDFSNFTIETFYLKHSDNYSIKDIDKFKADQKIFFNLPYEYIYHTVENKIVSYIMLAQSLNFQTKALKLEPRKST